MDAVIQKWSWRDVDRATATCSVVEASLKPSRGFVDGFEVIVYNTPLFGWYTQVYSTRSVVFFSYRQNPTYPWQIGVGKRASGSSTTSNHSFTPS
jgi:hypothetical protein